MQVQVDLGETETRKISGSRDNNSLTKFRMVLKERLLGMDA